MNTFKASIFRILRALRHDFLSVTWTYHQVSLNLKATPEIMTRFMQLGSLDSAVNSNRKPRWAAI
jgi:hypothetical protein